MILSNIHEPVAGGKPFAEREGLVFIGGFQHPPNVDAVLWYAQEILPRVRAAAAGREDATSSAARCRRRSRRSRPTTSSSPATSPTSTPYFNGCRVSIAPLRYGAGVKGKVNLGDEPRPAGGRDAGVGRGHAPVARGGRAGRRRSAEAFADAIVRLYRDEALWQKLAAGGVENIRRHFSRDVARGAVKKLIALAGTASGRNAYDRAAATRRRRKTTSHTPWPSFEAARLELGQRPVLGPRREAGGGVLEQRLRGERREDLLRVVLPVRRDVQVAAGREAQRELVHERRLQQPPLVVALLRPRDRERRRGCRRATPAGSSPRRPRPRRAGSPARWRARAPRRASAGCPRPARAPRCRRSRRPARARAIARGGLAHAAADLEHPRRGAAEHRGRNRAAAARTEGRSAAAASSSARCCAGDIRPWRSTKLRTGRRGGALGGRGGGSGITAARCGAASRHRSSRRSSRPRRRRCRRACTRRRACPTSFHVAAASAQASVGFHASSLRTPSRVTRHTASSLTHRLRAEIGGDQPLRGPARAWARSAARSCGRSLRCSSVKVTSSPSVV